MSGQFCSACASAFQADGPVNPGPAFSPPLVSGPPRVAAFPPPRMLRMSPVGTLGNWVQGLLYFAGAVALVLTIAAIAQRSAWNPYWNAPVGSFEELSAMKDLISAEDFHRAMLGFSLFATVAAGVVFIIWLHRVMSNVRARGATGTLAPGWAVGAWFIPLANLVLPAIMLSQSWQASDPEVPTTYARAWRRARRSPLVIVWAACFAASGLAGAGGNLAYSAATESAGYNLAYGLYLVSALLSTAAAVLAAQVVRQLSHRQEAVAATFAQSFPATAADPMRIAG